MPSKNTHQFSADRPIERLDEDKLQRRAFAESTAQAITTWHGDDSLVMALYGGWGDGKTSVKGMVVDAMNKNPSTCPYIVHFNPWEWAGQNQLAQVFFDEIGKQIAHQGSGAEKKKAQECGLRLQKLGKYLNLTGTFMTPLGYAASMVFPLASLVTEAMAKGFKKSSDLAKQAGEAVEEQKEREGSDLLKVKSELKEALTVLGRTVVVFMDDIDRLAADEIKLLFQLVKANSDFPNLIFFLFFQRDIIEQALERTIQTGSGQDYLEKIIQVPLSLPHIQRPLLESFMESKLREVLARRGLKKSFDWTRFKDLWNEGLNGYFSNLRDVARFFGTFEFQAASFPSPAEFDAVDLFALEVLRVFEIGVYNSLATSRQLLRPEAQILWKHHTEKRDLHEAWRNSIKQIADGGKASRPETVDALLKSLFPVETYTLEEGSNGMLVRLQKAARVGHPAFFNRYFHLCIPQGDIPQTELFRLLKATSDTGDFKRRLLRFDRRLLAWEALNRLSAYSDRFMPDNAGPFSLALFDVGDQVIGSYSDHLWPDFANISSHLIEAHLAKLPRRDEKFDVLKTAIQSTTGLYIPSTLLTRETRRAQEHDKEYQPRGFNREDRGILENVQLNELARISVENFQKAAGLGSLKTHPKLKEVLDWWLRWSRPSDEAKLYFRKLAATNDGVVLLLEQYVGGKLRDGSQQQLFDSMYDRGLIDLEQFMVVDEIKARVEELGKNPPSEHVANLCTVFAEVYKEHERNKGVFPDGSPDGDLQSPGLPPGDQEPTG